MHVWWTYDVSTWLGYTLLSRIPSLYFAVRVGYRSDFCGRFESRSEAAVIYIHLLTHSVWISSWVQFFYLPWILLSFSNSSDRCVFNFVTQGSSVCTTSTSPRSEAVRPYRSVSLLLWLRLTFMGSGLLLFSVSCPVDFKLQHQIWR